MKIDWIIVLRDALGVLLLGFFGRLVGGSTGGEASEAPHAVYVIVLMTAGFCVSGCLAKRARFKHLVLVAVGVWLVGTIVSAFSTGGLHILSLGGIALIAAAMLLGGLISLVIVKPPPAAPPPDPPPPAASPPA